MIKRLIFITVILLFPWQTQAQDEQRDHTVTGSGLSVDFPDDFTCEPISSPFASPTRYDGSSRRGDRNNGRHGGMDLSLKTGTPLLAIAAGKVIAVGKGGRLEGIFIELSDLSKVRHLPKTQRIVRPAVVTEDGGILPPGSKTVWPVACQQRKTTSARPLNQ